MLLDKRMYLPALVTEKFCPGAQTWLWRVLRLWNKTVPGSVVPGPGADSCSSGGEGLLSSDSIAELLHELTIITISSYTERVLTKKSIVFFNMNERRFSGVR